jgi:cation diffusion facilitator CzcD-associated flavoprotein CzcO
MSTSTNHNHVAIIGTGFRGIAAAIRLRQNGFEDFVLLDRAAEVDGVWQRRRACAKATSLPAVTSSSTISKTAPCRCHSKKGGQDRR